MIRPALFRLIVGLFLVALIGSASAFTGAKTDWKGFDRYDFEVDGRKCIVVAPETVADGRPWVWRARFFGHEPQADIALLKRGFHLAYCDVAGLYGNPQAVKYWDAFYREMVEKYDLGKRPALEGMSRGGLIIYNWAAKNPDKVSCIYGDAPVCDIKSWPGGKGKGKGSEASWKQCLAAYSFSEAEGLAYRRNPINNLEPLAKAGIPLLHVVGDADDVVPVAENTGLIEKRYKELGGSIQVIHKPGVGHHPHALKDPTQIVEFIVKHEKEKAGESDAAADEVASLWAQVNVELEKREFEKVKATRAQLKSLSCPSLYLQFLDARVDLANKDWLSARKGFEAVRPQIFHSQPAWLLELDIGMALCYKQMGQQDLRLKACQRIIDASPGNMQAHWGKVQSLLRMGRIDKAVDAYEVVEKEIRAFEKAPSAATMRNLLRMELLQQERLPEGRRNFDEARALVEDVSARGMQDDLSLARTLEAYHKAIGK